jgi:hypothetical protein
MTKHLHQMLRERDQRRTEEEAARVAAAANVGEGGGAGDGGGDRGRGDGSGGGNSGDGSFGNGGSGSGGSGSGGRPEQRRSVEGGDEPLLATLRRPVVLASLFFTFALGLFVGSRSGGVAEAAGGDGAGSAADETPSDAPAASAEELRRLDANTPGGPKSLSADLTDPKNRFTIQVASYNNKASAQAVAEEHVEFLASQGLRVVGPLRVGRGEHLVVLVEAAPDKESLEVLCEQQIRALPDSRGTGARFPGAYVREIDRLIER